MVDDAAYDTVILHFDTGVGKQIDERTTWHGSGWVRESGSVHINVGPETTLDVKEDGSTAVYHKRRRVW